MTLPLLRRIMAKESRRFLKPVSEKGIAMMTLNTDVLFVTPKTLMTMVSQAQGYTRGLPYNLHSLFETQRTNWQAMVEAQESLIGSIKTITRQQTHIMDTIWRNHTAFLNLVLDEGTPEGKIARHAEVTRKHYKELIQEVRKWQDTMTDTLRNAADILHHRTVSTLSEGQRQAQAGKALLIPANADDMTERKTAA